MFNEDDEIREVLQRIADGERFDPIDSDPVVRRGRRGVRVRRVLSCAVASVMVATVALTATELPGLRDAEPVAPTRDFSPMPGVEPGDAALQQVSLEEALRRCRVQWAAVAGSDPGHLNGPLQQIVGRFTRDTGVRPGSLLEVSLAGGRDGTFDCFVPGDSQPSATALADARRDSVPTDPKEQLRRCSTQFWHDITGWRIVSSSVEPGVLANLIAIAPTGDFVAHCSIGALPLREAKGWFKLQGGLGWRGGPRIDRTRPAARSLDEFNPHRGPSHMIFATGIQTDRVPGVRGVGWLISESDRMPRNVARLRVRTSKRIVNIPVRDGWFTVAVGDLDPSTGRGKPAAQVTAYDASGRYLGRVPVVHIGWPAPA